jgi:glycosyl-4,4'-diaponeurosporenoate acyltransferase
MPLIIIPDWAVITLDIILWLVIHLVISKLSNEIPISFFEKDYFLFKIRNPKKSARFYERVLMIKKWKKYLPDGAKIFKDGFEKKSLKDTSEDYLKRFILESKRAEISHYLQMLPVPIFFLFNLWWVGLIMIGYALLVNLPCVFAQRYNRPRFEKILKLKQARK